MTTPKKNVEILREWREKFALERARGAKKGEAYQSVAKAYDVSPWAVRYYLDPRYRDSNLRSKRKQYRRLVNKRRHQRNYHRLIRNTESFLTSIFESPDQISSDDIAHQLSRLTENIRFRSTTIQKTLDKYIGQGRGPPYIEKVSDTIYRRVNDPSAL